MEAEQGSDALTALRRGLPDAPGVYKFYDADARVIYVGKAGSLKKRVNSYFTKQGHDFKTRVLVRQVCDIQTVLTSNDMEALLLENNLIKQYQPKYNLMLKDGKTYPYICVKQERFPRVFSTRTKLKDGSLYYGPYASVSTMRAILTFLRDSFKVRTCNLVLSDKNIQEGKFRPCLEYHMGKCAAPCVGNQTEADYNEDIRQIKQVLAGRYKALAVQLKDEMVTAAAELRFERAQFLKRRLDHVQKFRRKSTVVSEAVNDVEVITLYTEEGTSAANHFKILSGSIVQTHSFDLKARLEETDCELLEAVIAELLAAEVDLCPTVLVNVDMQASELAGRFKFRIPERGDELKLLELSLTNCKARVEEKLNIARINRQESPQEKILQQLQKDLRLNQVPRYIECFDNSNIQGYAPVSSCVVFRNGRPAKRDYRVYNVKTVEGPDDFASMHEVVFRRYRRLLEEQQPLPDLIVIDGGKGQLASALEALSQLGLVQQIAVVSIAKRLEEIYFKDDPIPLYIDKKSSSLRLLQQIRNEAHDTAIGYHRKRRDEKTLKTELTVIPGVGPATTRKLLTQLRTVKKIQQADLAALAAVVGQAKAAIVWRYYHPVQDELTANLQEKDEQTLT